MFPKSKYAKWYLAIVAKAREEKRSKTAGYYESHHVTPKSFGGSDRAENRVLLTAREHFVCHVLLAKMYPKGSVEANKMLHAVMLFKGGNEHQIRTVNSRLYETLKVEYASVRSKARKGKALSDEQKAKISASVRKYKADNSLPAEARAKISEKARSRVRKPFSAEYKARHAEIMRAVRARKIIGV